MFAEALLREVEAQPKAVGRALRPIAAGPSLLGRGWKERARLPTSDLGRPWAVACTRPLEPKPLVHLDMCRLVKFNN